MDLVKVRIIGSRLAAWTLSRPLSFRTANLGSARVSHAASLRPRSVVSAQSGTDDDGTASQAPQSNGALLARRAWGFAWPLLAFYLAYRQVPVGKVEVAKSDAEWRDSLSPNAYHVLIARGTERAFTSPLDAEKRAGTFRCSGCSAPLFSSDAKFNSGTGWPSFSAPIEANAVDLTLQPLYCLGDLGAREVRCHRCGGHLGHVFSDGPQPTGKRFCMNGVAMQFEPSDQQADQGGADGGARP